MCANFLDALSDCFLYRQRFSSFMGESVAVANRIRTFAVATDFSARWQPRFAQGAHFVPESLRRTKVDMHVTSIALSRNGWSFAVAEMA